jgi:putative zinc finger protein
MTNDDEARTEHPDELLAGYADGSASPDERHTVEAHLVSCSQCRDELVLAKTARAALTSLPELEAPGLTVAEVEALQRAGPARAADEVAAQREARQTRRQRHWKASWVALGGVAAVLALFAIVPLVLNRGGSLKQATGGSARRAAAPNAEAALYPQVRDRGIDYDQAAVRALAQQLAKNPEVLTSGDSATPTQGPLFAPVPSGRAVGLDSSRVVECAIRGAGLPANTIPKYLEIARFRATPAYVVAVLSKGGSKSHLIVYVVSQEGCAFLFEADQPL